MREAILKFGKQSMIYGMGNIGSRFIAFLLLPLYVKYLTPADYGILQICNVLNTVLLIIIQLGLTSSMFKVYFQETDTEKRKVILSTTVIFFSISSLVLLLPLFLLRHSLAPILIGGEHSVVLLVLIIGAVYFEGLITLGLSILRAEERSKFFAVFVIVKISIYALLNILFVAGLRRGYQGSREAIFITMVICFVAFVPFFRKHVIPVFRWEYIKELLQLGIPLAIAGLGAWVLNFTDRYMLMYLLPENVAMTQVGLYSLGAKFAMLLKVLIITPFMLSWGPLMFAYQHDKKAKQLYSKVLNIYVFVASLAFILVSVFGENIIRFMSSNPDYYGAYIVIPYLALSYVFLGSFRVFTVGVTLRNKTYFITIANLTAAVTNVILNFILIRSIGMIGAVYASMISFLLMTTLLYLFSQKVYPIPYKIMQIAGYLVIAVIFVFAMIFFEIPFIPKTILTLVFLGLLPMTRVVTYNEVLKLGLLIKGKIKMMVSHG